MTDIDRASFWTGEQWVQIRQAVVEEARAARVAGNVLPLVGPLGADASFVPELRLLEPNAGPTPVRGFSVDEATTLPVPTLQTKVFLRHSQLREPELTSAVTAFRRAANVLAHVEDAIVFTGQPGPDQPPALFRGNPAIEVLGGGRARGLADGSVAKAATGESLVTAVSGAIGALERRFQTGPFACVLGAGYFKTVQSPNGSLVLPQDRILPFLNGGPLVRSSALDDDTGLLIALGAAPIELVLATDVSIEFLQATPDAWFMFRVYEKMVLRIKDPDAVQHLNP